MTARTKATPTDSMKVEQFSLSPKDLEILDGLEFLQREINLSYLSFGIHSQGDTMQATVELTEQEYEALESHVKKAITIDKCISVTPGFMQLSACDRILGKLYLALAAQSKSDESQKRSDEG